jgi:hypothetical protein
MILPIVATANFVQLLVAEAVVSKFEAYAPVAADSGGETWFDGSGIFLCPDAATWGQVWDTHVKNESIGNSRVGNLNRAPAVDFDKNFVVALFAGPTRNVLGYRVANGFSLGNQAILRLTPLVSDSNVSSVAVPRPWIFLVLKRTRATITIQTRGGDAWVNVTKIKPTLGTSG